MAETDTYLRPRVVENKAPEEGEGGDRKRLYPALDSFCEGVGEGKKTSIGGLAWLGLGSSPLLVGRSVRRPPVASPVAGRPSLCCGHRPFPMVDLRRFSPYPSSKVFMETAQTRKHGENPKLGHGASRTAKSRHPTTIPAPRLPPPASPPPERSKLFGVSPRSRYIHTWPW